MSKQYTINRIFTQHKYMVNSMLPTNGNRIREERKKLGLTQGQAAEQCGVRVQQWNRYENEKSVLDGATLRAFAAIGADAGYILSGLRTPEHILDAQTSMLHHSLGNQELTKLAMKAAGNMNEHYAEIKPQLDQLILLTGGLEKEDMKVLLDIAAHLYKLHTPNPPMSRVVELVSLLFMDDAQFKLVAKMLQND